MGHRGIIITLIMAMQNIPFTPSSNIRGVMWDSDTMTLTITFKAGVYQYYQVPQEVADGFGRALSATSYFKAAIQGQYPENRVF